MSTDSPFRQFEVQLLKAISEQKFLKLSLGNYKGSTPDLKNIYVRKVIIKREAKLAFTYRYKTRDIFKNFGEEEGQQQILTYLKEGFYIATLFLADREFILELNKKGNWSLRSKMLDQELLISNAHDRSKKRIIDSKKNNYLAQLKITDSAGNVFKNAQDKFKQINQYIEILSSLIKELPSGSIQKVVDMGSGKGYLTFALYDYLHHQLHLNAKVTGVEYREDLVSLCNEIAVESKFHQLDFVQGAIDDYQVKEIDLLIALHACDTATDDAIFKGIEAGANLIVVAPCCHKQIRREMEKGKAKNNVSFLTKYGIFLERQAEMVTDGIRALILEYFGYKTKVFEFISDAHTPKNVLVVGVKRSLKGEVNSLEAEVRGPEGEVHSLKEEVRGPKDEVYSLEEEVRGPKGEVHSLEEEVRGPEGEVRGTKSEEQKVILQKIKDTKAYFGIEYHHLERLLGI